MKRYLYALRYLVSIHLLGLILFTAFRWVLYLQGHDYLAGENLSALTRAEAFIRGLWIDNVVACYITILPLITVSICALIGYFGKNLFRGLNIFFSVFYILAFAISAADIPYFAYFFKHINASIFNWFGYTGTTLGLMFGEFSYIVAFVLFLCLSALFIYLIRALRKRTCLDIQRVSPEKFYWRNEILTLVCSALLIGGCMFGIRGRMGYNPIKVSAAYYCNNTFLNQLGISPAFNLLRSSLEASKSENREIDLMDDHEAIACVRRELHIVDSLPNVSPIARRITNEGETTRPNVVLVFMESMSADLMQRFGQRERLTPVLDSLWRRSMAFSNFWSAGIHTNQGITATLYAFPALGDRNIMKGTVTPRYTGLPTILHRLGYRNLFFMTHEALYDNMQAFLLTNGFDEIVSQPDYPEDEVVNSFGVSDRSLFRHAVPRLSRAAAAGRPFMAALLTVSNHPPYVISDGFRPRTAAVETQIVEYADWAIGQFLADARREPWYSNTVFVLVGDHGKIVGRPDAALPQSMNHVPLMVFGPGVPAGELGLPATQTDVTPTLLAMLGVAYDDCGFGRNLLEGGRRTVAYSASSQIAARDSSAYYVYDTATGRDACYSVLPGGRLEPAPAGAHFDSLRRHAFAVMQTAEFIYRRQP